MKEEKVIKKQLKKNMLFNFFAFAVIFSVLGVIIYSQFRISLYSSADEELLNIQNRAGIIRKINKNEIHTNDKERITPPEMSDNNRMTPPQGESEPNRNEDASVNPRLVYIYRNESGEIEDDKSSVSIDESFKNIEF